ncbi:GHKL domain protein [Streptococcus sp. AS20]|uniref:sensor histidine kinase n=1 Tax=Streptococcus sp. AS20 TaxID=936578 RepID=UPI000451CDA4|nr:ATP-binding protein [Streptococcus sp. AS20]EUB24449.1 GHKL domain protein [Streptococcus sp. AS20]
MNTNQEPEKLKYVIEDRTLAAILGVQNFSTDESAVLELVKNAYDAGARKVIIEFSKNLIRITDNGSGMNYSDIHNYWMHVGENHKLNKTVNFDGVEKMTAGSMGIGRFALARLGKDIELKSKKKDNIGIVWKTDWDSSTIEYDTDLNVLGTSILISDLREKWPKKKIEMLKEFLSRTYNDNVMEIIMNNNGEIYPVKPFFVKPQLGINCLSSISFNYSTSNFVLSTEIQSDEFEEGVDSVLNDKINPKYYCSTVNIFNECLQDQSLIELLIDEVYEDEEYEDRRKKKKQLSKEVQEEIRVFLKGYLNRLGNFSGEFYFYIKPLRADLKRYFYKYSMLESPMREGIILYRNAFSISSFDGKKDWLELGKRSRKSPAAASHPSGAWRLRENQISGKIDIDKQKNKYLEDMSNRQGLNENVYFDLFKKIILVTINQFEKYRQTIIREISKYNKEQSKSQEKNSPLTDIIIKDPKKLQSFSDEESTALSNELKEQKENEQKKEREQKETEEKYKYDVRLLNMLATSGLKASSIAHEIKNDRTSLINNIPRIKELLCQFELWSLLESKGKTSSKSIPYLLERVQQVNEKLLTFVDAMISELEVQRFKNKTSNIFDELTRIKRNWENDYNIIKLEFQCEKQIDFKVSPDVIQVILDNLILNSIQNNNMKSDLKITILVTQHNRDLEIHYFDNGVGLNEKFSQSPRDILEIHETSRSDGHGLGMWIVNNSILESGGDITKIYNNSGFNIKFYLGEG